VQPGSFRRYGLLAVSPVTGPGMTAWEVIVGDVLEQIATLPDGSVQCCVTSPPYWGLRQYLDADDPKQAVMIGLEPTLAEHLARIVEVFREVRRVLRDDGVCWLNYGDAYAGGGDRKTKRDSPGGVFQDSHYQPRSGEGLKPPPSLAAKQRLLMPARVALALQDDGWWVRSEIVWAKGVSFCPTYSGSCMPSSVRDRPTDSHEMMYLLSKAPRYFYDGDAVREESICADRSKDTPGTRGNQPASAERACRDSSGGIGYSSAGRNLRTVWCINPRGYKEAHFATFPPALVEPCVKAGTSERGACSECGAPWRRVVEKGEPVYTRGSNRTGADVRDTRDKGWNSEGGYVDGCSIPRTTIGWEPTCPHTDAPTVPCVVLDPFSGSGTTGAVAVRLGRSYVGIELNPEYAKLSRKRIGRAAADVGHGGTVTADEDERAAQLGLWV